MWVRHNGAPADVEAADRVIGLHGDYTNILQAALAHMSLSKQLSIVIQGKRLETTARLRAAHIQNQQLRFAQFGAFAIDVCLVGLFGMVLLGPRGVGLRHLRALPSRCRPVLRNPAQAPIPSGGCGLGLDGGMAELMLVPDARHLVPLPDQLHPATAAPLTDAALTPYHAVRRSCRQVHGDRCGRS